MSNSLDEIIDLAKKSNAVITFDFDSTLSHKHVQEYAKILSERGYEIGICTSRTTKPRYKINGEYPLNYNQDLYTVANEIDIKPSNIIFTHSYDKSEILKHTNVLMHFDDDDLELELLGETNIQGLIVHQPPTESDYRKYGDKFIKRIFDERIVCSAIKVSFLGTEYDGLYLGLRHADCFMKMTERRVLLGTKESMRVPMIRNNIQGFLTTENRFVNRKDAMVIAKRHNQVIHNVGNGKELYSENLY